jgi:hypothetical protein
MEISPAVASELALLSRALDEPSDDLARRVTAFSATVKRAVPSYLGLTLHLREDPPVHLTSMITDDTAVPGRTVGTGDTVGTSLLVPLLRLSPRLGPGRSPPPWTT